MCWKECRKVLLSKRRFNESESLPIDVFLSTFSRNRNILVRRWNDFVKKYKKILLSFDGTMKSKKTLMTVRRKQRRPLDMLRQANTSHRLRLKKIPIKLLNCILRLSKFGLISIKHSATAAF